jgi:hypothetical protein
MGQTAEKLPSHTDTAFRKSRRYIKQQTAKKMRRLGKKLQEDAPKSVIKGWSD